MLIKLNKWQIFLSLILLIFVNLSFFYLGFYMGETLKSIEIESKSLLPAFAKQRITLPFPQYSSFTNISTSAKENNKRKIVIQIGAYKDINNAKRIGKKLEAKGYKTEIKTGKLNILFLISEGDEKEEIKIKEELKKEGIKF